MDFSAQTQKVEQWTLENNKYELLSDIPTERKFIFKSRTNRDVSFYIICPVSEEGKWQVWSDNELVLPYLGDIQDLLDSCRKKSIIEILDKTTTSLYSLTGDDSASAARDVDEEDLDDGYEEEELDEESYYNDLDEDAIATDIPPSEAETADDYFTGDGSILATKRLLSDLKNMKEAEGKFNVIGEPRGENLFIWDVKLTEFPADTSLGKDLQAYAKRYNKEPVVYMEMKFPKDYPMAPPFVRVLEPRFKFLTGHVTIGGSVCMQMLTRSGWCPSNDIESILVQIRAEIMSDPNTRLDANPNKVYTEEESKKAFDRMVQRYGWNK